MQTASGSQRALNSLRICLESGSQGHYSAIVFNLPKRREPPHSSHPKTRNKKKGRGVLKRTVTIKNHDSPPSYCSPGLHSGDPTNANLLMRGAQEEVNRGTFCQRSGRNVGLRLLRINDSRSDRSSIFSSTQRFL